MIYVDVSEMLIFMETMGDRLKAARVAAKFSSAAKAAEALGISASTYRAHENGQNEFHVDEAKQYAKKFGVTVSFLLEGDAMKKPLVNSYDPDDPDVDNDETLTFGSETGFRGAPEGTSPQIDITGGMGAGGLSIVSEGVPGHKGMTFAAEAVSDYWRLPPAIYTSLGLHPQDTVFIPVQGDSMYPTLEEGDVIVVDTRHRWPSPDGIYAILDEIGGLVVKRLEVAQENGENVIRIISDNTRHRIKEKRPDDVFIVGRVLRRFGVIK